MMDSRYQFTEVFPIKMWVLGLDTSTERALLVLSYNGQVKAFQEPPLGLQSSRHAMPLLADMFKSMELSPKDLGAIAVGVGPGSYTGIRVGVAIGKALAFALAIPLISFCGMELFMSKDEQACAVILDARMSGAYLLYQGSAKLVSLEKLVDILPPETRVIGPSLSRLQQQTPSNPWVWEERSPSAKRLVDIMGEKWNCAEYSSDGAAQILYLRETHAEFCKTLLKNNV